MVLVDDADLLFAGDICFFGVTPLAFQGNPATWADVLDVVGELAEIIVPGHGPVGGEPEIRALQQYLRHCVAVARGDEPAIPSGPWDTWPEHNPRDAINIERAQLLAGGRGRDAPGDAPRDGLLNARLRVTRLRGRPSGCARAVSGSDPLSSSASTP